MGSWELNRDRLAAMILVRRSRMVKTRNLAETGDRPQRQVDQSDTNFLGGLAFPGPTPAMAN